jgi:hypothetical protein
VTARHLAAVQTADVEPIDYAEGVVLDGPSFVNLYRLLDLERSAVQEWQQLSMPAAFEILAAFESEVWKIEKQTEWDEYEAKHGVQPSPSITPKPHTKEAFYKWVQERAARDGHPPRTRATIQKLRNAAECSRIVQSEIATRVAIPQTEGAWRPVYKFLKDGWRDQIVATVERAAEIAEEEGGPITDGRMSIAAAEIRKTDPQYREWAEQPGQTVDPRSKHDRAVTLYIAAKAAADALKKGDDGQMWRKFYNHVLELDLGS